MCRILGKNNLLTKAIAILIIASLIYMPMNVKAEDSVIQTAGIVVTLDSNGGKLADNLKTIELTEDGYYSPLANVKSPTRIGYDFAGWFDLNVGGEKINPDTLVKKGENHSIYAHWNAKEYKVTFNGKGGAVSKKSIQVIYDSPYGKLATATKKGYGFLGWYTSGGKIIKAGTIYKTAGPTTLYAGWGSKHKIYFNANGGKVAKKSKTVTKGLTYGTMPTPKRKGYTFLGWYTKKKKGTKIHSGKNVNISKSKTVYAKWKLTNYTVTFNPRGGKVSKSKKTVNYNRKYGKLPKVSKKGYIFKGWYTKKSGGSKITSKKVYKLTKSKTLYAKWQAKKITLKFHPKSGKVSKKSKIIKYNKKYGKLPKPKRKGYKFKGWYSKKKGGIKLTKSSVMKYDKNKTVYASWAKISTLKFNYNRGKKGKTKKKNIVYSEKYGSLPRAKRAGYKFLGWYTKKSGGKQIVSTSIVRAKKNITLYARWEFVLNIKKAYAPKYCACRPGLPLKFKGVTIHNTGNSASTANALNHAKYLQNTGKKKEASWHYCVDEEMITQSIPENEIAWHAGDGGLGFGNNHTIAIEICMNEGGDIKQATDRAAKLAAYILAKHGYKTALSKKNIFQHNHHSGKNCPQMIRKGKPYSWNTFVNKVNSYL